MFVSAVTSSVSSVVFVRVVLVAECCVDEVACASCETTESLDCCSLCDSSCDVEVAVATLDAAKVGPATGGCYGCGSTVACGDDGVPSNLSPTSSIGGSAGP